MLENRIDSSQRTWDADHPSMADNNRDLLNLGVLYEGEHFELLDALLDFLQNPTEFNKINLLDEAADVVLFLTQLIHLMGSTLEQVCMDKRAYNMTRYIAGNFQTGMNYDEGRQKSRAWVKERNWKQQFYQPMQPAVVYDVALSAAD